RRTAAPVARDAVADVMEALRGATVDLVAGAVRAVSGLERGHAVGVARERERRELELQLDDLFDRAVATESIAARDGFERRDVDELLRAGDAHVDHRVLEVAEALEVILEAVDVRFAELRAAFEIVQLLADEVVHALAPQDEHLRRRIGAVGAGPEELGEAPVHVEGVALRSADLTRSGERQLLVDESTFGAGVQGE